MGLRNENKHSVIFSFSLEQKRFGYPADFLSRVKHSWAFLHGALSLPNFPELSKAYSIFSVLA